MLPPPAWKREPVQVKSEPDFMLTWMHSSILVLSRSRRGSSSDHLWLPGMMYLKRKSNAGSCQRSMHKLRTAGLLRLRAPIFVIEVIDGEQEVEHPRPVRPRRQALPYAVVLFMAVVSTLL